MGVQGLLPLLEDISERVHVSEYKGKRIAVDGYVWLHKGAYGCADELAKGVGTTKYVNYGLHRARMLVHHGITPVIVLDGANLPSKSGTESDRDKRRSDALAKGKQLLAEGKDSLAREQFVKAVDVTPQMAYQLIKALRQDGIDCIVAPYEADAQLAYLEKIGYVDAVLTEDSDLLVFGTKQTLYKLDSDGFVTQILRSNFAKCTKARMDGWRDEIFRAMCILSGCDYLEGIRGIGLKTAHKLLREFRSIPHVIAHLRRTTDAVPMDYNSSFERADRTFLYQRVYCPIKRKLVHLNEPPANIDVSKEWPFVGHPQEDEYAQGVAEGSIDPVTRQPMIDIAPTAFISDKKPLADKTNKGKQQHVDPKAPSILNFFKPSPVTTKPSVKPRQAVSAEQRIPSTSTKVQTPKGKPSKFFRSATGDVTAVDVPLPPDEELDNLRAVSLSPRSSQAFVDTVKREHDAPEELLSPHQLPAINNGGGGSPSALRSPSRRKRARSNSSNVMFITSPMTVAALTPVRDDIARKRIKREPHKKASSSGAASSSSSSSLFSSQRLQVSSPVVFRHVKHEIGASLLEDPLDDDVFVDRDDEGPPCTDDTTPEPVNEQPDDDEDREVKPDLRLGGGSKRKRELMDTSHMDWTPRQPIKLERPQGSASVAVGKKQRSKTKSAPKTDDELESKEIVTVPAGHAAIASDWKARWAFKGSSTTSSVLRKVTTPVSAAAQLGKIDRPPLKSLSASMPRIKKRDSVAREGGAVSESMSDRKPVRPSSDRELVQDDETPVKAASRIDDGLEVLVTNKKLLAFRFSGTNVLK